MPKGSVVIATYNCAKYICEAINSVLKQTFKDYEIIVIDDGSTDDTKEVLNDYINKKLITYIYQQHSGVSKARNLGINSASGEYILFLDADDILMPNVLENEVLYLDKHKDICLISGQFQIINESGALREKTEIRKTGIVNWWLIPENQIILSGLLLRRNFLLRHSLFFKEEYDGAEDYLLWLEMSKLGKLATLSRVVCYYRQRPGSFTCDRQEQQKKFHALALEKAWNIENGDKFRRLVGWFEECPEEDFAFIVRDISKIRNYFKLCVFLNFADKIKMNTYFNMKICNIFFRNSSKWSKKAVSHITMGINWLLPLNYIKLLNGFRKLGIKLSK